MHCITTYQVMKNTVVIRDVDEVAYRNLKGEAVKAGVRLGDAASEAFRDWAEKRGGRIRDRAGMTKASKTMDEVRRSLGKVEGWNSVEVIRKWRESRGRSWSMPRSQ